jgi:hypothetical protein
MKKKNSDLPNYKIMYDNFHLVEIYTTEIRHKIISLDYVITGIRFLFNFFFKWKHIMGTWVLISSCNYKQAQNRPL